MSNQDRPTPEDIPPQSDYPASQQDLVPQPNSNLSNYSPANKLTGKVAFITGQDSGDVVINTGSVVGKMGKGMLVDYSTSKGAVHTFTKSLTLNLDARIWVNSVVPDPVLTPNLPSTMLIEKVDKYDTDGIISAGSTRRTRSCLCIHGFF